MDNSQLQEQKKQPFEEKNEEYFYQHCKGILNLCMVNFIHTFSHRLKLNRKNHEITESN